MNCCMQDAWNLGWKLAMVVNGCCGPELLDSYEAERRPIAEQVIWAASSLHEIFMGHGKDISERSQRMNDQKFLNDVVGACSGITYTYRDYVEQPQSLAAVTGPAIGDRAPDADLLDGRALYDCTRHPDFTLLAICASDSDKCYEVEEVTRRIGLRYEPLLRVQVVNLEPGLEKYYGGEKRDRLYLIRPDGYIGYRCLVSELDQLENYLEELFIT